MLGKKSEDKKVNVSKVNELVSTGSKILKLAYTAFIILLIYVVGLIFKEWGILSFLGKILATISPLFIGFFIAWLLNPLVKKLREKNINKTLAIIITYFILLASIYLIFAFTVPSLAEQISEIVSDIPDIVKDVNNWLNDLFIKLSQLTMQNLDSVKTSFILKITNFATDIEKSLPSIAMNIVSSVFSGIGNILLSLVIGFYLLFDYDKFTTGIVSMFPKKHRDEVITLTSRLSETLYQYVSGTLWLSLLLFVVLLIGFSIIGLNAPILIAFVCIITNLIPYIGPYLGAAVAGAIGFVESPVIGILTLIFILIVQMVEGNLVQPLIMSKKLNVSPTAIILSLLIFGYMWGIFGMIIATPLVGIIKIIYQFFDEKYHFFEY